MTGAESISPCRRAKTDVSGACSERLPCGGPDKPDGRVIVGEDENARFDHTLIRHVLKNKKYKDLVHRTVT